MHFRLHQFAPLQRGEAAKVSTPAEGEAWAEKSAERVIRGMFDGKWVELSANGYPLVKLT